MVTLKFYICKIRYQRRTQIKQGDEVIGNETGVKVVKNKVAPPFKQAEFDIMYGKGCSYEGVGAIGVAHNFIEKSGSWYSYGGQKIGREKKMLKRTLKLLQS